MSTARSLVYFGIVPTNHKTEDVGVGRVVPLMRDAAFFRWKHHFDTRNPINECFVSIFSRAFHVLS